MLTGLVIVPTPIKSQSERVGGGGGGGGITGHSGPTEVVIVSDSGRFGLSMQGGRGGGIGDRVHAAPPVVGRCSCIGWLGLG